MITFHVSGRQMAERLGNWAINQKVAGSIPCRNKWHCVLGQGTSPYLPINFTNTITHGIEEKKEKGIYTYTHQFKTHTKNLMLCFFIIFSPQLRYLKTTWWHQTSCLSNVWAVEISKTSQPIPLTPWLVLTPDLCRLLPWLQYWLGVSSLHTCADSRYDWLYAYDCWLG